MFFFATFYLLRILTKFSEILKERWHQAVLFKNTLVAPKPML